MSWTRRGVSLVEVLVAVLLLTIGLAPIGYGYAAAARISRRAEARTRIALVLSDRMASLERVAGGTAPPCEALHQGAGNTAGVDERWMVSDSSGFRVMRLYGRVVLPGLPLEDSLRFRVWCP
jgi:prepilin-type N-terminal cleavage/methylation domain-containing protein